MFVALHMGTFNLEHVNVICRHPVHLYQNWLEHGKEQILDKNG